MKTIDLLITVTYDDDMLNGTNPFAEILPDVEGVLWGWGSGYVTYVHAREVKGIRE